ncbi:MAG: YdeI/OmpD-associated family protein [Acidobacteriia bacterium]|nr:YdeI/OmpD-associated family protein [Terriglobia bacterium]
MLDGSSVRRFANQEAWAAWLGKNYHQSRGLWLRLAKKGSGLRSISYSEALDVALCYGWIDGQKKSDTERTWLQKFVPRSANSVWSKINREKATALIASGRMKPAGLKALERAKKSGRWETAYDPPSRAVVSPDLQMALDANPRAKAFFESLDGANRYAVLFRIQTVKKPETRAKKIRQFVEMLERNKKIHPSRQPPPSSP